MRFIEGGSLVSVCSASGHFNQNMACAALLGLPEAALIVLIIFFDFGIRQLDCIGKRRFVQHQIIDGGRFR